MRKYTCPLRPAAALLAAAILVSGCANTGQLSRDMADLAGSPAAHATGLWGEPHETRAFGDGTLLIWRDYAGTPGATVVPAVICERLLAVDGDGAVTGWRWRGDACETSYQQRKSENSLLARRH